MFDAITKVHLVDDFTECRDARMFVVESALIIKDSGFRMFYGSEWTQV